MHEEALNSGMCVTLISKYFIRLTSHVCFFESEFVWFALGQVYEGWVARTLGPVGFNLLELGGRRQTTDKEGTCAIIRNGSVSGTIQ